LILNKMNKDLESFAEWRTIRQRLKITAVLAAAALCFLCIMADPVFSEGAPGLAEIKALIQEAETLIENKEYDQALLVGEKALEKARTQFNEDHPVIADVLDVLGGCHYHQRNFDDCERRWKQAHTIREKALGPGHPAVGWTLYQLGHFYSRRKNLEKAEQYFNQAMEIFKNDETLSHGVTNSMTALADIYKRQCKYQKAESIYLELIEISESRTGAKAYNAKPYFTQLVEMYKEQGKFKEAASQYEALLEITINEFGPEHFNVAEIQVKLARFYMEQGDAGRAETFAEQARSILIKVIEAHALTHPANPNTIGREYDSEKPHPRDLVVSLIMLALLYQEMDKKETAELLYKRALDFQKRSYEEDHIEISNTQIKIARFYHDRGQSKEAKFYCQAARQIVEKHITLNPAAEETAHAVMDLAKLYVLCDQSKKGKNLYKKLKKRIENDDIFASGRRNDLLNRLEAFEKQMNRSAADSLNLAELYQQISLCERQGNFKEAERLFKQELEYQQKTLGTDHLRIAEILERLGWTYEKAGRYKESTAVYKQALDIRKRAFNPDQPDQTYYSPRNLVLAYERQGKYREAEALLMEGRDFLEKYLGPDHPQVGMSLFSLANFYMRQERLEIAKNYYMQVIRIVMKNESASNYWDGMFNSLNNLAILFEKQSKYSEAEAIYKQLMDIFKKSERSKTYYLNSTLIQLASFYKKQERYEEAASQYEKILKIYGVNHSQTLQMMIDLARLFHEIGRSERAESLCEQIRRPLEKTIEKIMPHSPVDRKVVRHNAKWPRISLQSLALALNKLADLYHEMGQYENAEHYYLKAIDFEKKVFGPEDVEISKIYLRLSRLYRHFGKHEEALSSYEAAQGIIEREMSLNPLTMARQVTDLALLYCQLNQYPEAERLCEQLGVIIRADQSASFLEKAKALNILAIFYTKMEYLREAESLLEQIVQMKENVYGSESLKVAGSKKKLGWIYFRRCQYRKAESLFKEVLETREKQLGPDHSDVAKALNNLAVLYSAQSKIKQSETTYKRALKIVDKILGPEDRFTAVLHNNLGLLYRDQDNYEEAASHLNRALEIRKKTYGSENFNVGSTLRNLAWLYFKQGKYRDAENLFMKALDIFNKEFGPDHLDVAYALNNLGVLYKTQGKYLEAESLYRKALNIKEKYLDSKHREVSTGLSNLANIHALQNKIIESVHYFKAFQQSRQQFVEELFSYASEEQKMRYLEKYPVLDHSLLSFAILHNPDLSTDQEPENLARAKVSLRETALDMVLKAKALVVDAVAAEKEIAYCIHDRDVMEKYQAFTRISGEMSELFWAGLSRPADRMNVQLDQKSGEEQDEQPEDKREKQFDTSMFQIWFKALSRERDALETELSHRCAPFKDDLAAKRFTMTDVAQALPQGSLLWEFVRYEPYDFHIIGTNEERTGPPRYLAMTLNHEGEITLTDLGDAETIDGLIAAARERINKAREEVYFPLVIQSEKQLRKITSELYGMVFAPLEESLGARTEIFISPDGQLNLIPFEILPCPDGRYVIEKYRISYLSSGRDLLKYRKRPETGSRAVVMADPDFDLTAEARAGKVDTERPETQMAALAETSSRGASVCLRHRFKPLEQTGEEGQAVLKMLKEKADLDTGYFEGDEALEEDLKGMSAVPVVLHLATHGFFCEDTNLGKMEGLENPLLRCGLALAGANSFWDESGERAPGVEDGILTAFEASGLNLVGTELVTLSACETGVGEVKNGEGVFGLRRAFQHAGARSIVMSLWKVQDRATRALMESFYRRWLGGQSKREALRGAALEILKAQREKYGAPHPYLWGSFVLLGDGR